MTNENLSQMQVGIGRYKGAAIVIAFFIFIALAFSSTKNMSIIYFAFGVVTIFSGLIYLQAYIYESGRKKVNLSEKDFPSIAVLIPNRNSSETIEKTLRSIVNLKYPKPFNIFVLDDCSTDNCLDIVQRFVDKHPSIKIIRNEKNIGKAANINNAIKKTDAEIVACIDSDTYPAEDALMKMVPCFYHNGKIGAVTAFITTSEPKNLLQKVQELEYFNAFGFTSKVMSNINGLIVTPGPMTLFKREVLIKIGGFDEKNLTEDLEIGLRLQKNHYAIEYCPDAVVPTEVPDTFKKLYRQRERWYRGTIFNLNKYREMMLNKKYENVGLFSYPTCILYVGFTILTFSILSWSLAKDMILRGEVLLSGLSASSGNLLNYLNYASYSDLASLPLFFNSVFLVFFGLLVCFWIFCLYNSMKMAKMKLRLSHAPAIGFILIIYPMMISLFYLISSIKELCGSGMRW